MNKIKMRVKNFSRFIYSIIWISQAHDTIFLDFIFLKIYVHISAILCFHPLIIHISNSIIRKCINIIRPTHIHNKQQQPRQWQKKMRNNISINSHQLNHTQRHIEYTSVCVCMCGITATKMFILIHTKNHLYYFIERLPAAIMWNIQGCFCFPILFVAEHSNVP